MSPAKCWPCVFRPQCINSSRLSDAYMFQSISQHIGSDNGLLPVQHQAILWSNTNIFFTGPLGLNFTEISIKTQLFLKKMYL